MRVRCLVVAGFAAGSLASSAVAEDERRLTIAFSAPPEIAVEEDFATGEETFSGTLAGTVLGDGDPLLAGTSVDCEFDGYTFEARGFSCGFTDAESVAGICLFTAENGDTAVAEWRCRTGATMTSDARCEGTADWIEGTGAFAGISGGAKLHSDLFLYPTEGTALWKGDWRIPRYAALDR